MFLLVIFKTTMALHVARSYNELIQEAKEAEENNEFEKAAKIYERAIRTEPHEEQPYNRLMVIYRKLSWYEDELKIIKKGIAAFEELYQKKSERLLGKNQSVARLSKALAKSLGQKGNKAQTPYYPEPVPKWMKRQKVVEKKLGMG
jgi:tetratricopeptide (TPR) repeat protein